MRNYGFQEVSTTPDRILCAASYLTGGIVGFIWLIIAALQRATIKSFIKYHILQSIFLSVIAALIRILSDFIFSIVKLIPVVGDIVLSIIAFFTAGIIGGYSIIQFLLAILIIYFVITTLMGKYSYFPWISDNIRQMI